jgi:hypothetical protein
VSKVLGVKWFIGIDGSESIEQSTRIGHELYDNRAGFKLLIVHVKHIYVFHINLWINVMNALAAVAGTTPFPKSLSLSTLLEDPLDARPSLD